MLNYVLFLSMVHEYAYFYEYIWKLIHGTEQLWCISSVGNWITCQQTNSWSVNWRTGQLSG